MGVNGMNGGAATYALQKAQEMPKILIEMLRNSIAAGNQPLAAAKPAATPLMPDLAAVSGKGKIIDFVA